ncbi:low molecular weight phosphotyrosine protein phosphatase [Elizabethkingia argentiflava]|uniref:protein-tyrosine-phosphatase n=1 Tax=Elizabethkingia argenteiflava TaxID=2681556 RepID=A0A845PQ67_9FLAO|nr:low molecular weight protein-tyrosine-phosphatase [Elizabethkingia argenteiflava]NAW50312.1 low molecular weight phosphotyrosine protein phosphatase [Elizabethkingia argenteiflava]
MKILMVCLGNICRSPLAEGLLRAKLPSYITVDSAGIIAMHQGEHPDPRSIKIAAMHGIDISKQCSRPIQSSDLEEFDRIYCMDFKNLKAVKAMDKDASQHHKISLILEVLNDKDKLEVPDPYWGNLEDFEKVYQLLDKACNLIANEIL